LDYTSVYDVIVVGVGGSGSSIIYHLAKSGFSVLGLEQFNLSNTMGSSHGETRIFRVAYHEDPAYVGLLKRAYELWLDLEKLVGEKLLTLTGCLSVGFPASFVFEGCVKSAELYGLRHEVLDAEQVMKLYPAFKIHGDMMAVYQYDAGFLRPERCINAYATQALRAGAEIRAQEKVESWSIVGEKVEVVTNRASYKSRKLVVSAGAWSTKVLGDAGTPLEVERQVVGWFRPRNPEAFQLGRLPVWILSEDIKDRSVGYGFPINGLPGFKLGVMHHRREIVDPDSFERRPNLRDESFLRGFIKRNFGSIDAATLALETCLFTNTSDGHFVLDFHPRHPQVIVVSCCSGHGFKFCSVIGETVAQLCSDGVSKYDIQLFSLKRKRRKTLFA
jgi:sarcosine oxidase